MSPQKPQPQPPAAGIPATTPACSTAVRRKLSNKEQRELDALPDLIDTLEKEQAEIGSVLAGTDIYQKEPQRVAVLQARYGEIETELEAALVRWEELGKRSA